jgi:hypothetical protein
MHDPLNVKFLTEVSRKPVGPIFKGKESNNFFSVVKMETQPPSPPNIEIHRNISSGNYVYGDGQTGGKREGREGSDGRL